MMVQEKSAWQNFTDSLSAPMDGNFVMPFDVNATLFVMAAGNASGNATDMTVVEQFAKHLQKIVMNEDGSFLVIPFSGAIYIALVFVVLVVTYCRHFSHVDDRRIRWIRHSTNSTCLTGPGTMTVICNNWVYLCRQHGHFGISSKKPSGYLIRKMKMSKGNKPKTIEMSIEDITIEQSNVASTGGSSYHEQMEPPDVATVSSTVPMRRTGSSCFPWTSYPTPAGVISYRELGEPAANSPRYRPETPAGAYYCVSGRHTPADEQLEFWDYTPELERKATNDSINAASGGPSTSGAGPRSSNNVSFASNLPKNLPSYPSSPGSPGSNFYLPRPSLNTPNLSALARAGTTAQGHSHNHRRRSSHRRRNSLKSTPNDDEVDTSWNELMAAMLAKPIEGSKPTTSTAESGSDVPRERTGSTGSNKEAIQMHQLRSHSPTQQQRRQATTGPSTAPSRPPRGGGDDDGGGRRQAAGGILAIVRMGQDMRNKQSRYN